MKQLILLTFLLYITSVEAQENWLEYQLDSIITVSLPGEVYELDTIMENIEMYQIFSNLGNSTFVVQKTLFEKENQDEKTSNLPYDSESLNKQYQDVIRGIEGEISYTLVNTRQRKKDGFEGYQLLFEGDNSNINCEVRFYLLNKYLYTFFYLNEIDFDKLEQQRFYNSIQINTDYEISQFLGVSMLERRTKWITKAILRILFWGGIIYLISRVFNRKKK